MSKAFSLDLSGSSLKSENSIQIRFSKSELEISGRRNNDQVFFCLSENDIFANCYFQIACRVWSDVVNVVDSFLFTFLICSAFLNLLDFFTSHKFVLFTCLRPALHFSDSFSISSNQPQSKFEL